MENEFMIARRGRFTASEIWKLFTEPRTKADKDAGKFSQTAETYILEKAVEISTGYRPKFTSKEIEHGLINEPEGFSAFLDFVDIQGWHYQSSEFYPIGEDAGASPDGICLQSGQVIAVVDIKCPQPLTFFGLKAQGSQLEVDAKYFYQLQMQMLATNCEMAYLCYYLASEFGNTFTGEVEARFSMPTSERIIIQKVPVDKTVQDEMIAKIKSAVKRRNELISNFKG